MKPLSLLAITLLFPLFLWAQGTSIAIDGTVIDKQEKGPILQGTIQLLHLPDSTMARGTVTDEKGYFSLRTVPGTYLLKVSYVGYAPMTRTLTLTGKRNTIHLNTIELSTDAVALKEAVITARAVEVVTKSDTLEFNAGAFRVPEGSSLEALIRKLPGAEINSNGKVTINGREISKIMVDGKEFFANDPNIALKNLPAHAVDKVKSYDKRSDLARITGIDDGEEETVLDLSMKRGMNKGWFGNVDVAGGTKNRYSLKTMLNRFVDNNQLSLVAQMNNDNDNEYTGGGKGWRDANGLITKKLVGVNFVTTSPKLETGGNVSFEHRKTDVWSLSSTETFVSSTETSFRKALSTSLTRDASLNSEFKIEWKPNSLTNLIFRPRLSYNDKEARARANSYTFSADPEMSAEELSAVVWTSASNPAIWVNSLFTDKLTQTYAWDTEADLQINRRLSPNGRNLTLRLRGGYTDNDIEQLATSLSTYYQTASGVPTMTHINRTLFTPTRSYTYATRLMYSEPLLRRVYLQLSYEYRFRNSTLNNRIYDMLPSWSVEDGWDNTFASTFNMQLSKRADYDYHTHRIDAQIRWMGEKHRFNAGISLLPQHTQLSYEHNGRQTEVEKNIFNFTPTLDFNYQFSKRATLRINYRGKSTQPSMTNLLEIEDNTDPLNIRQGNASLKPTFSNSLRAFFNSFNSEKIRGIMAMLSAQYDINSITQRSTYNSTTGGYVTRPENINGNWNIFGMLDYNTALRDKHFTINSAFAGRYNNINSYMSSSTMINAVKASTRQLSVSERLRATYRNDWLEVSALGSIAYTRSTNTLRSNYNSNTYVYTYGANATVQLPWEMSFSSDVTQNARRGYSDSSMNRNEWVWNMQFSKSFLAGNAATISLQLFDILRQQSNISRTISASMRQDVNYNAIFSYGMLHFIYKLNVFGSKQAPSAPPHEGREGRPPRERGFGEGRGQGGFNRNGGR